MMGPCRISAKLESKMKRSVCAADTDDFVAENFGRLSPAVRPQDIVLRLFSHYLI